MTPSRQRLAAPAALALLATLAWSAAAPAAPSATITGSFANSCRDFQAHSSKDISHVAIHYADGRVVSDEDLESPDFSIVGDAGEEILSVIVKSGTTRDQLDCQPPPAAGPPTAVLERKAGKSDQQNPEGSWTSADCVADVGLCVYGLGVSEPSVSFRGVGSTDPDDDIMSWSIDFGDGASTGGSWPMPAEVVHDYGQHACICSVVLTVTDSAGRTSSDSMLMNIDNDGFD